MSRLLATILIFALATPVLGQAPQTRSGFLGLLNAFTPEQPHPAVVRVIADEGGGTSSLGSGTLIAVNETQGLVVTNWHVVKDGKESIRVVFPNGFESAATVLKTDKDWDLAALAIWKPNVQPVPMAAAPPRPGDMLTIAGYGHGPYRSVTGPFVQYLSPGENFPFDIIELTAAARNGDSGGPIFNQNGELAGVLFGEGGGLTSGSHCGRVRWFIDSLVSNPNSSTASPGAGATTSPATAMPAGSGSANAPNFAQANPAPQALAAAQSEANTWGSPPGTTTGKEHITQYASGTQTPPHFGVARPEQDASALMSDASAVSEIASPENTTGLPASASKMMPGQLAPYFPVQSPSKQEIHSAESTTGDDLDFESETLRENSTPVSSHALAAAPSEVTHGLAEAISDIAQTATPNAAAHSPEVVAATSPQQFNWEIITGPTTFDKAKTFLAGIGLLAVLAHFMRNRSQTAS